jgi:hypothetical protein
LDDEEQSVAQPDPVYARLLPDNTGQQLGDRHADRSRERAVVRNRQHA